MVEFIQTSGTPIEALQHTSIYKEANEKSITLKIPAYSFEAGE